MSRENVEIVRRGSRRTTSTAASSSCKPDGDRLSEIAVITGAYQAIGAALADAFHRSGYSVVTPTRGLARPLDAHRLPRPRPAAPARRGQSPRWAVFDFPRLR
jgi:hypothetical protein